MKVRITRNDVRRAFRNSRLSLAAASSGVCQKAGENFCNTCIISDKVWNLLDPLQRQAFTVATGYAGDVRIVPFYNYDTEIKINGCYQDTYHIVKEFDSYVVEPRKGATADSCYKALQTKNLLEFEIDLSKVPVVKECYKLLLGDGSLVGNLEGQTYTNEWTLPRHKNSKLFGFDSFQSANNYHKNEWVYAKVVKCLAVNPVPGFAMAQTFHLISEFWNHYSKDKQAKDYPYQFRAVNTPSGTILADAIKILDPLN